MNRKGEVYFNDCLCGIIEENDQGYSFQYLEEWINSKMHNLFLKPCHLVKINIFLIAYFLFLMD